MLECRVCERSAQGVSLTADGEILYAATQRAFSARNRPSSRSLMPVSRHP
nr:Uncharacterised protein [Klebsiella pneumoniae]